MNFKDLDLRPSTGREQKEKTHEKQVNFMFEHNQENQSSAAESVRHFEVAERGRVQIM